MKISVMDLFGFTLTLVLGAATVPGAPAQNVHTDWDSRVPFGHYHNYCWGPFQTSNPLWEALIQDAVNDDLQAKGWERNGAPCDVTIMAVGATQNVYEYETFYSGMGDWRWSLGEKAPPRYRVGTLVLDVYDTSSKRLIFRGVATDALSTKSEYNERHIHRAVDKILGKFPRQNRAR